jgi:RNA polymerase sigma-B factor
MSVQQNEQTKLNNKELFLKYKKDKSLVLRNQLVENYLYIVDILVRKYLNKGVEYDDLYQVGSMALVFAVERFEVEKGFEFTSFATPTIIGEIKRYFRDKGWAVKVPRRLKELGAKLPHAKEELESIYGRPPKVSEIAIYLHCSEEEILEAMESHNAYGTYSLSQTFEEGSDGEESSLESYLGKEELGYEKLETFEMLEDILNTLSTEEKKIFRLRFIDNITQQEIAQMQGVSQMTISRIEKKIRAKFRKDFVR